MRALARANGHSGSAALTVTAHSLVSLEKPQQPAVASVVAPGPTITIHATWVGEHRFDTGRPGGPVARFDGSADEGQNPVDALVSSLASCVGIDVVDILSKRRTPVERLTVEAHAERRAEHPRRVERVTLRFVADGEGVEIQHTERAIALSMEKYCSVSATLSSHVEMQTMVVVNGVAGEMQRVAR